MALYRENYRPSERFPQPYGALCVWAMAAETEAEAARLFSSREMWRLGRDRGIFAPLPSPQEAAAHAYSEAELQRLQRMRSRALYGTARVVGDKLRALAAEHGVDEIAVLTTLHDPEARRLSYTLLARELELAQHVSLAAE